MHNSLVITNGFYGVANFNGPDTLILNNSTVANNGIVCTNPVGASTSYGGGIDSVGTLILNNSTVVSNSITDTYHGGYGGGIYGTVIMTNTIVSGNTATSGSNNIDGSYSGISNLVDVAGINLAPLGNYGGPTQTMLSSTGGANAFQFTFTNVSGADFTALTSTNLALPLAGWTVLGNIPEISPGIYQFTDPQATNNAQRFYRVTSP